MEEITRREDQCNNCDEWGRGCEYCYILTRLLKNKHKEESYGSRN